LGGCFAWERPPALLVLVQRGTGRSLPLVRRAARIYSKAIMGQPQLKQRPHNDQEQPVARHPTGMALLRRVS